MSVLPFRWVIKLVRVLSKQTESRLALHLEGVICVFFFLLILLWMFFSFPLSALTFLLAVFVVVHVLYGNKVSSFMLPSVDIDIEN